MQQLVAYGVDDLAPEDADTLPQFRAYAALTNSVTADPVPSGSIDGATSGFNNEALFPMRAYPSLIGALVIDNGDQYEAYFLDGVPPGSAPVITPTSLLDAAPGSFYTENITVTGGLAPYVWRLIDGALPPGMTFDDSSDTNIAVLSGTPTEGGLYNFTIRVWDAFGQYDDQVYDLLVIIMIEITPDLGLTLAQLFDDAINPQIVQVPSADLIDVTGQTVEVTYRSVRKLRISVDIGDGLKQYEIPSRFFAGRRILPRRYLMRLNSDATTVTAFRLIP
jgi:Putative Ig domain